MAVYRWPLGRREDGTEVQRECGRAVREAVDPDVDWAVDLLEDPVTVADGQLQVPDGPGLGIELNMDAVRDHEYEGMDQIDHIDLFESNWEDRAMTDPDGPGSNG